MNAKFHISKNGMCQMDLEELYKTLTMIRKDIEDTEIDDSDAVILLSMLSQCRDYVEYERKYGERPQSDYNGLVESCIAVEHDIISSSKWFLDFLYPTK